MSDYSWLGDVDEGLADILRDLNQSGYTTTSSCSGHLTPVGDVGSESSGLIEFATGVVVTSEDVEEVSRIVREYTDVPFLVRKGRYARVKFEGSLVKGFPSTSEARDILSILRGVREGGPGRSRDKLSRIYDLAKVERAAAKRAEYYM